MTKHIFKLLTLVLIAMLAFSGCSLVKVDEEIDKNEIVAEYDGGAIIKADAQKEFDEIKQMYLDYGYEDALNDEATVAQIKQEMLEYMLKDRVFEAKAKEFGVDTIPEEKRVELVQQASEEYNSLIEMYMPSFRQEGQTDDEARESTKSYLEQYMGANEEIMQNYALSDYKDQMMFDHVTKDVVLTDEQLKAAFDEAVEADEAAYTADPTAFEQAVTYGESAYWVPEGYRTVKHILIKTPDEMGYELDDLDAKLSDIEAEIQSRNDAAAAEDDTSVDGEGDSPDEAVSADLVPEADQDLDEVQVGSAEYVSPDAASEPEAAAAPDEAVAPEAAETPDEPAIATDDESLDEDLLGEEDVEEEEPEEDLTAYTMEQLEARKAEVEKQIDEMNQKIRDALLPKAQEVADKIKDGGDFEALLAEYGEDPGMTQEPHMTTGYYVGAGSTMWDPAFTAGAMALAQVGDVSEPVYGQSGYHIIRYQGDVTPGPVDYESVKEALRETALENAKSEEYERVTQEWVDALNPKYYPDRL